DEPDDRRALVLAGDRRAGRARRRVRVRPPPPGAPAAPDASRARPPCRVDGAAPAPMIWALLALLTLAVLAPVLLALRGRSGARGARELAVQLHRTQLQEVDRDLAEG